MTKLNINNNQTIIKIMKSLRTIPALLCTATMMLLLASCGKTVKCESVDIVPRPISVEMQNGTYKLKIAKGECVNCALKRIDFTEDKTLGEEAYTLTISKSGIAISASSPAGAFYAKQTLRQMIPAEAITDKKVTAVVLPCCTIKDAPHFAYRGAHLDVCRHFFTVNQIERHLDLMAAYKLNRFHWHLTDDQGWRIEIDRYPQLNDIGSWHVDRTNQPWGYEDPARPGEEPTYGGFYTKKEIAEIVEYAAQRNIEVIPEIDLPGHASAILASYPELACDDHPYTVAIGPYWPPKAVLCVGNDQVMQFVSDILDEVTQMFPSEYIHIGGDVTYKANWESCPRCQTKMRQLGLANENELQGWFLHQVDDLLARKGRRMIGWDEIMDCTLPDSDAVIMAWRGDTTAFAAALHGYAVISANPSYCNFEYYQADSIYQSPAFPQYLTLYHTYQYDPIPPTLTENAHPYVWGGQCMLWTDYITTYDRAEYQLLPRLCAIAECLWTPLDRKDWPHFQAKIEHHKARLRNVGYNVCPGSFKPVVTRTPEPDGLLITITTEVKGSYVYYTTDGSDPTPESPLYTTPLHLSEGTLLRTLTLFGGQAQEGIYDFKL